MHATRELTKHSVILLDEENVMAGSQLQDPTLLDWTSYWLEQWELQNLKFFNKQQVNYFALKVLTFRDFHIQIVIIS